MALIFDGIQNLTGKNLPNVRIDNISLSVGLDPEPESNPHINSSREIQYVGTQNNVAIQSPTSSPKQIQNKNFFCDITLSILNYETFGNSLVLGQVNYLDFVYVKIIQSLSQNLTNELLQAKFPVDVSKLTNISDYSEKIVKLSEFYDNKILDFENSQNNVKLYKHLKQVRFTSKNPIKQHLDVFAFAYLDIDELINSFELNVPNGYSVSGYVAKESVISNFQVNTNSYVLTDEKNNVFIGSPIKGTNGKFYRTKPTSIANEAVNRPLNVVQIINKKISDYRDILSITSENISNVSIPVKTPDLRNIINLQNNYISEIYTSRQRDNIYSSLFMFDIISYLKSKSTTPEIYDDIKCLEFIKIKKINIIRQRVKTVDSVVYEFSQYTPDSILITTSEKTFGNISYNASFYDFYNNKYTTPVTELENGNFNSTLPSFATIDNLRKIATISEITLANASNYRTFVFTDYEISKLTTGEYKYKVEIEIEDQTKKLIEQKINVLSNVSNKLKEYLSEAERVDMFSVQENKQTTKFVNFQNAKYNNVNLNSAISVGTITQSINIQKAPWIEIPAILVLQQGANNLANDVKYYYTLLNPSNTNPTKINIVLNSVNSLISSLRSKYDIDEKIDKNTKSFNSNINKTLTISHIFNKVIDSETKKVAIDYIDTTTTNKKLLYSGPTIIPSQNFNDRINTEILKYFPTTQITIPNINDSFSIDDIAALTDIQTYSTCYLSPAYATFDKTDIKLNTTDSTNLNFSAYDSVINKSVSTNSKYNKSFNSELLTKSSLSLNTVKNFATNLNTSIQLSFITKETLLLDATNVFNNSGFNTQNITFNLNDVCGNTNEESVNESNLLNLSPLTNVLLENYIKPETSSIFSNITPAYTIDKLNIFSNNSIINSIKQKRNLQSPIPQMSSNSNVVTKAKAIIPTIPNTNNIKYNNPLLSVPLQTKSLMLGSVTKTKFNLSVFGFDPFLNPQTKNFMRLNFQIISQIEYLAGFEVVDNIPNLNKPIWRLLTKTEYDALQGLIIIRTKQYDNKLLNIQTEANLEFDVYDEYVIVDKSDVQPTISLQQQFQPSMPNIMSNTNINVNNNIVNTTNIFNSLVIPNSDPQQAEIIKQLAIANITDNIVKSSYTFSKLELDHAN